MLEKEGKIAKFIPVDFSDAETVFDKCMQVGVYENVGWVGVRGRCECTCVSECIK